jgi:hypothetical protein
MIVKAVSNAFFGSMGMFMSFIIPPHNVKTRIAIHDWRLSFISGTVTVSVIAMLVQRSISDRRYLYTEVPTGSMSYWSYANVPEKDPTQYAYCEATPERWNQTDYFYDDKFAAYRATCRVLDYAEMAYKSPNNEFFFPTSFFETRVKTVDCLSKPCAVKLSQLPHGETWEDTNVSDQLESCSCLRKTGTELPLQWMTRADHLQEPDHAAEDSSEEHARSYDNITDEEKDQQLSQRASQEESTMLVGDDRCQCSTPFNDTAHPLMIQHTL